MVKSHHDYIYNEDRQEFVREFDEMYKKFGDPHGQMLSSQNYAHTTYLYHINEIILPMFNQKINWLDVGCGLGFFTGRIHKINKEKIDITGIDLSLEAVKKAKGINIKWGGGEQFDVGNLLEDDFKKSFGKFDVVSCFETLYYFKANEILLVINNLLSCVKKNAFIILSYHLPINMNYGHYIKSMSDLTKLFKNAKIIFSMDYTDNFSKIYSGETFGRHLFVILKND